MYDFLRGVPVHMEPGHVILDVSGVGYHLEVPGSTYDRLADTSDRSPVKLFTHFHVREDAHKLYGFGTEAERRLFEHLLTIKGIGPTLALNILSGSSIPDIVRAIKDGDARFLDRIRGVGKKTAERVVLELREKAEDILASLATAPVARRLGEPGTPAAATDDALRALLALGFGREAARKAVDAALASIGGGKAPPVERLVREALRHTS